MTTTFAPDSLAEAPAAEATPIDATPIETVTISDVESAPEQPPYVSIYASSIFAVTMVFLFGVGVPCWLFLNDAMSGFGLGAMCAVWGGPSFGVIAGSARLSAWQEAHDADH